MNGANADRLFLKQVNLYRLQEQVDHLVTGVAGSGSRFILGEDTIKALHKIAMFKLLDSPGEYRQGSVTIDGSPHLPPNWIEVPTHMTALCKYVNDNWGQKDLVHLAAFVLWRLNWIHPFLNGNGRTARAVSYLVLCAKHGALLPAKNSVVHQIMMKRDPYYAALRMADDIYAKTSNIDKALEPFVQLLSYLLKEQIKANLA